MGVVIYEALTGIPPFASNSLFEILKMHVDTTPRTVREDVPDLEIHPKIEAQLKKVRSKSPEDRWQSAGEFVDALRDIPEGVVEEGTSFLSDHKARSSSAAGTGLRRAGRVARDALR